MKNIRYMLEAALVRTLFFIFRLMPAQMASNIGGFIVRTLGPHMAVNRKAIRNLRTALPGKTDDEYNQICRGMWDNLGRVFAEYPHLETIGRDFTQIVGLENLGNVITDKQPVIYISGHLANWEINATAPLVQNGITLDLTYREPNNPWSAELLDRARTLNGRITTYAKSRESGRAIIQALKDGRSIGILIDQKYNEGVESLFFGIPAMTNPVFVHLCQKYRCPLIPARAIRTQGCRFVLEILPPIDVFAPDGTARPTQDVIADAHALLEGWIKEKPEQWIWLHRRWKT